MPPRVLSHLQTSPSHSNDSTPQKCNSNQCRRFFAVMIPQWARTISSQKFLQPPRNLLPPPPTAALSPPHLILVPICNTQTSISTSTSMGPMDSDAYAEGVIDDEIDDDGEHESNEADPRVRVTVPAPVQLDARPKKRRRTTTLSRHCPTKTRRPKVRCTLNNASAGDRCCKLYCNSCITKQYVLHPVHPGSL